MIDNGTWPVPILAVRNEADLVRPDGLVLAQPFHLVEAHHRLGYLRALVQDRRWTPATEHSLWSWPSVVGSLQAGSRERWWKTSADPVLATPGEVRPPTQYAWLALPVNSSKPPWRSPDQPYRRGQPRGRAR